MDITNVPKQDPPNKKMTCPFWEDILKDWIQDTHHGSDETARWLIGTVILLQGFYFSGLTQIDFSTLKLFYLKMLILEIFGILPLVFWNMSILFSLFVLMSYKPLPNLSNPDWVEKNKSNLGDIFFSIINKRFKLLYLAIGSIFFGFAIMIIGYSLYLLWTLYPILEKT